MNKLKTLKELSLEEWKDRKEFVDLWVKVEELKEEAIRWIKDARENNENITEQGWMEFFNISEEMITKEVKKDGKE